jgi:hypothetical protein
MLNKLFNWLLGSDKKEETAEPAPWPFPVSKEFDAQPQEAPKVTRKPKAKKATTTKKKAPAKTKAKAKPKTTKTKKTTTKKPSK